MTRSRTPTFTYQDGLRAVGAWLDVRGYREIRIVEHEGTLVVEAAPGTANQAPAEVLRFDANHMERLRRAALNDRGAPRAYPDVDSAAVSHYQPEAHLTVIPSLPRNLPER